MSWASGDSSFSVEDLMSNLLGFYAAVRGFSPDQLRRICGEVSMQESYRIWDEHIPGGIGQVKSRRARPFLFSTNEGVKTPADTAYPGALATIQPAAEGNDWVRPDRLMLDQRLLSLGAKMEVSRDGRVGAAKPGSLAFPARGRGRR